MKVLRSKTRGTRAEVLAKIRGLEIRCEALEHAVNLLAYGDQLRRAIRRIAELEEQTERKHRRAS